MTPEEALKNNPFGKVGTIDQDSADPPVLMGTNGAMVVARRKPKEDLLYEISGAGSTIDMVTLPGRLAMPAAFVATQDRVKLPGDPAEKAIDRVPVPAVMLPPLMDHEKAQPG